MKHTTFAGSSTEKRHPRTLVNFCFILVFLLSTLLIWREGLVLKSSYEAGQIQKITAVANALERQWQHSIDQLMTYRGMLRYALHSPIETDKNRQLLAQFEKTRHQKVWQLNTDERRGMPLNGVSDAEMKAYPILTRSDAKKLRADIMAALDFSHILQFTDPNHDFEVRTWYLSRSGFFVSSVPPRNYEDNQSSLLGMIARPYFKNMQPSHHPSRDLEWTPIYEGLLNEGPTITVVMPIDQDGHWYGVLAMDFSRERIHQLLQESSLDKTQGVMGLLDKKLNIVAVSDDRPLNADYYMTKAEQKQFRDNVVQGQEGQMRFGTRFISWTRLHSFDGILVNIQSLDEGLHGGFGRITLVLILMWVLFSVVLLISHQAILRLVNRMTQLQKDLSWRAHYDDLTRLYNRAAFFDSARRASAQCQRGQSPISLIQIDLDHFKAINDKWGHHAGDLALSHAACQLSQSLRQMDIAGRVGGEEFCILLPDTSLRDAHRIAERLRNKLAQKELLINNSKTIKVTASFGVASSEDVGDYNPATLQSVADRRLYSAKQQGRNQVCSMD